CPPTPRRTCGSAPDPRSARNSFPQESRPWHSFSYVHRRHTAECAGAIRHSAHRRTVAQRTCSVLVAGQLLGSRREIGEVRAGLLLLGEGLDGDVVISGRLTQCAYRRLLLRDVCERVEVVPTARVLEG